MPDVKRIIQLAEEFGIGPFKRRPRLEAPAAFPDLSGQTDTSIIRLQFSAGQSALYGFHYARVKNWDGLSRLVQYTDWSNADATSASGWQDLELYGLGQNPAANTSRIARLKPTLAMTEGTSEN